MTAQLNYCHEREKMTTLSKKILIVDDDESIRNLMKIWLDQLGYDPEFAENGKEAFEILEKEAFPLIITDLGLLEIDGIKLCAQIREKTPETVISAFSGGITEFESDQFEEIGFDGVLCKPLKLKVLEHAIEGAFEKINKWRERLPASF